MRLTYFVRRNRPTQFFLLLSCLYMVWLIFHFPQPAMAIDPSGVIDAAQQMADTKNETIEALWKTYLLPPGPVYAIVGYLSSIIGAFSLIFVLIKWASSDDELQLLENFQKDIVWIIVLLIALAGNGVLMASGTYVEKRIGDSFLQQVESFSHYGAKFKAATAIASINDAIAPQMKVCEGKVGQEQIQCLETTYVEASKMLDRLEKEASPNLGDSLIAFKASVNRYRARLSSLATFVADPEKTPLDKLGTAFFTVTSPAWIPVVKAIGASFNQSIFNLIDSLLLALAIAGPLAAALSVAPFSASSKPFILWQVLILLTFAWKFLLIILDGLSSEILLNASADVDTLWFGFLTAILFPVLTFLGLLATGGNLFSAISQISSQTTSAIQETAGAAGGLANKIKGASSSKGRPKSAKASRFN